MKLTNFADYMENVKNIVFDFDGTLADTAPLIVAVMHETIRELGLPELTDEQCRSTIGIRLEDVPAAMWPNSGMASEKYAATYRNIYFNRMKDRTAAKCFPGVLETLTAIHHAGYGMAIASSRSRRSLEEYVEQLGIAHYFAMLVGGGDVAHGKPAPDPVLTILQACGWRPDHTLTVGDAGVDILMGRAAGTATCAVTYGNGTHSELTATHPDCTIDSFPELLRLI